jgi:hypothetical protein
MARLLSFWLSTIIKLAVESRFHIFIPANPGSGPGQAPESREFEKE